MTISHPWNLCGAKWIYSWFGICSNLPRSRTRVEVNRIHKFPDISKIKFFVCSYMKHVKSSVVLFKTASWFQTRLDRLFVPNHPADASPRVNSDRVLDGILIETTGMADPGPVCKTFNLDPVVNKCPKNVTLWLTIGLNRFDNFGLW